MSLRKIPFNDLTRTHAPLIGDLKSAFDRILKENAFIQSSSSGCDVSRFEDSWKGFIGTKHAIGCTNGTDALSLSLKALDIRPGAEVITTSFTFFATVEAILQIGAKPVFVDVEDSTGLIDASKIESAITPKTRAILPVHLYGQGCDMNSIMKLAQARDLVVIEDSAQAHGVSHQGKVLGSWGHAACFSFFPGKNLGALGDAGAITTNDDALTARLLKYRDHGRQGKYTHVELGGNYRLDGIQAAFLNVKFPHLKSWNSNRRKISKIYLDGLSQYPELRLLPQSSAEIDGLHLFVVRHANRDRLVEELKKLNVESGVHYPTPSHQQPIFIEKFGRDYHFPVTEEFSRTCLSLPLHGAMTEDEAHEVVSRMAQALINSKK